MQARKPLEPPELCVLFPDHPGIRECALTKVEEAVWPDSRPIRVVVTLAGKVPDERRRLAVGRDPQNPSSFELAALGHVEAALVERHTGPRPVFAARGDDGQPSVRLDS